MRVEGYGSVEFEIRSECAPVTAEEFCLLVDKKYYDSKSVYLFLDGIYSLLGSPDEDDRDIYKIRGEFEEAGFNPGLENVMSLKRGVVAMSRTQDGRSSDASSLVVFLSDCSYLDGKYAAFARITKGMSVFDKIAERVGSQDSKKKIKVSKSGEIVDEDDCPTIKSVRMVD